MGELSIERDEVFRIKTLRRPGTLAKALTAIGALGAQIGEIETIHVGPDHNVRDVTVIAPDDATVEDVQDALGSVEGVEIVSDHVDRVFEQHRGGKIGVESRAVVRTLQDIREVYTPGVARVVEAIAGDPSLANEYTWKGHTVAIVTNGTRVLGLGDVGPVASLPVMEGKALFYADLVGVSAVPLVLESSDPDELIETVVQFAPGFGGIHLEDIATPGVYRIEEDLERRLNIPVLHDDQHGTAVVVMAAVLAAARRIERSPAELVFGQVGLGAAGSAIAALASGFGFAEVRAYDPAPASVERLKRIQEPDAEVVVGCGEQDFDAVLAHSDVLVLTTGRAGLLTPDQIRPGQIVMPLSNPVPEISIRQARAAGAAVAADGTIVNNVLAYPGLFRGALDAHAASITPAMKRAAALVLAEHGETDLLLPDPLDVSVHVAVASAVAAAWS